MKNLLVVSGLSAGMLLTGCQKFLPFVLTGRIGEPPYTHMVILAGQSNMQGTAAGSGPGPNQRIESLGLDRVLKTAQEPLNDPTNAVDTIISRPPVGVGPGLFFANDILSSISQGQIILVPCAKGSTSINYWIPGGGLYEAMVDRARFVKSKVIDARVDAVLFWQGESDATDMALASAWAERFTDFVRSTQRAFPGAIIIFVKLDNYANDPIKAEVIRQQESISIPGVYRVNEDGILHLGDHTDENGYAEMAGRLADAYRKARTEG